MHELDMATSTLPDAACIQGGGRPVRRYHQELSVFAIATRPSFKAGVSLIEQEQPEEASQYFTDLVRNILHSEYVKDAKAYLEKLGKPIPSRPTTTGSAATGMVGNEARTRYE